MKTGQLIKRLFLIILALFILVLILHPLAWLLVNSVKTNAEAQKVPPYWLPKEPTLKPLLGVLIETGVYATHWGIYFINTIIVTVATTGLVVVFSVVVGYGLARFAIKGKVLVLGAFLIIQFLSGPAVMIPEFIFISKIGLYNTRAGVVFVYLLFQVPFATWLFYSFFQTLPTELEEAASVEGCSVPGVFWRITLPLSQVGIATVSVMSFILTWSEYPFARILLESDKKLTISIGLANYITAVNIYWNQMAAASLICGLPMLIILISAQKNFIRGLTAGAIKG